MRKLLYRLGYTINKVDKSAIQNIQALGKAYVQKEGIQEIPLISYNEYVAGCPPLFKRLVKAPNLRGGELTTVLLNNSMKCYYTIEETGKGYYFTDNNPARECYHNRQYMLFSIYRFFYGDLGNMSFLDVAGSSGYYSFHAARLGFRDVLCIDGRREHEAQFYFLKGILPPLNVAFQLMNVEELDEHIKRKFDVVSAQGILYHLYDQALFMRNVHRVTGDILILDTVLNGRMDNSVKLNREDAGNLRYSPFSAFSLAPSLPVAVELIRQGGYKDIYVVPYPCMIRDSNGKVVDGNGYGLYRRIMLVATV